MTAGGTAAVEAQDFNPDKGVGNLRQMLGLSRRDQVEISKGIYKCNPTGSSQKKAATALNGYRKQAAQLDARNEAYDKLQQRLRSGRLSSTLLADQSPQVRKLGADWNEFLAAESNYLKTLGRQLSVSTALNASAQKTLRILVEATPENAKVAYRRYMSSCKQAQQAMSDARKFKANEESLYSRAVSRVEYARGKLSESFDQSQETRELSDQLEKQYNDQG